MEQQFLNNNSKTIAIDFDGTIVEHQYPRIGKEMLFRVNDKTVTAIQAKENIEIVHAKDIKDMQRLANDEN